MARINYAEKTADTGTMKLDALGPFFSVARLRILVILVMGVVGVVGVGRAVAGPTRSSQISSKLASLLGQLKRLDPGAKLIAEARQRLLLKDDVELLEKIQWASVSKTNRTLIREWDPQTGLELQKSVLTIGLKPQADEGALILDLAHELTHAIRGPAWEPYDPDLTASRYIVASIEGQGGEVDAVEQECLVAREWMLNHPGPAQVVPQLWADHARCQRYELPGTALLSREKIQRDFYRVGSWKNTQRLQIDESVREKLSDDAPQLISSTGQAPYPVALLEEYEAMNQQACENTARRLMTRGERVDDATKTFLARRCGQTGLATEEAEALP